MAVKSTNNPQDTSPEKYDGPEDARNKKGAGVYPYYNTTRTRSGHVITLDDSEENESITIQHRGGSMVQFMPDGAVHFVSQNGRYTFVFGENRMEVHGAHDVVVHGTSTMRVEGNFDTYVDGNYNMVVNKDFNLNAKNFNGQIRGNMDLNAKNMTAQIEGSASIAAHGIASISGDGGVAIGSTSQGVGIVAATDIAVKSGAAMMIESGGKTSIQANPFAADASKIHLNSGESDPASLTLPTPNDPNTDSDTAVA